MNLEDLTRKAQRVYDTNPEGFDYWLNVQQKKGRFSNLETEDSQYLDDLARDEKSELVNAMIEFDNLRKEAGIEDPSIGWHTSPRNFTKGKVPSGSDGKIYFSHEDMTDMYAVDARFAYKIRVPSMQVDEKEIDEHDPKRFFTYGNAEILDKYTMDQFRNKFPEAEFREYGL